MVNGGSNLTYGIRTLYAKTFERFDKWLIGDMTALTSPDIDDSKPPDAVVGPVPDVERAQAEEAAAILESLGTMAAAAPQPAPQPVSKAINSKKRKASERKDAAKVRLGSHMLCNAVIVREQANVPRLLYIQQQWLCRKRNRKRKERSCWRLKALMGPASLPTSTPCCAKSVQQAIARTRSSYVTDVTRDFIWFAYHLLWMMFQLAIGSVHTASAETMTTCSSKRAAR